MLPLQHSRDDWLELPQLVQAGTRVGQVRPYDRISYDGGWIDWCMLPMLIVIISSFFDEILWHDTTNNTDTLLEMENEMEEKLIFGDSCQCKLCVTKFPYNLHVFTAGEGYPNKKYFIKEVLIIMMNN